MKFKIGDQITCIDNGMNFKVKIIGMEMHFGYFYYKADGVNIESKNLLLDANQVDKIYKLINIKKGHALNTLFR